MVLSTASFAVPFVLAVNNVEPLSGVPFTNDIVPAVPPDTTERPFNLILAPPPIESAHKVPEPTFIFAAYCAEHSTAVTVKNNFVPATASAELVEVITSVIALPKTSVPVIVQVLPLSPVPVVVTITFLAPPPANVVFAIVAEVSGCAAVTNLSSSEAFTDFAKWHFVHSIGGTDFISQLPVTVAANTPYHFKIEIDSDRKASIFVNGVQYNVTSTSGSTGGTAVTTGTTKTAALTDDVDFIPYIGIEAGAAAAEAVNIHYTAISRVMYE